MKHMERNRTNTSPCLSYDPVMYRYAGIMLLAVPDGVVVELLDGFLIIGGPYQTEYWTGLEWSPIPGLLSGMLLNDAAGIVFRCLKRPDSPQSMTHRISVLEERVRVLEANQ